MKFSFREHRLCYKNPVTEPEQPDYAENEFANLPDGTLFVDPDKNTLWKKQGNRRIHIFAPSEKELAEFRNLQTQHKYSQTVHRELSGLLGKNHAPKLFAKNTLISPIAPTDKVEVAYVPTQEEIHERCLNIMRKNDGYGAPAPLTIMWTRNEQLIAEKARHNDQSPIMEYPSNNLHVRSDWTDVPPFSFFVVTEKAYDKSRVYMKNTDETCQLMCNYEVWRDGLQQVTAGKDTKFKDMEGTKDGSVLVLSALTPTELEDMIQVHHEKLTSRRETITEEQLLFDQSRREKLAAFWANVA